MEFQIYTSWQQALSQIWQDWVSNKRFGTFFEQVRENARRLITLRASITEVKAVFSDLSTWEQIPQAITKLSPLVGDGSIDFVGSKVIKQDGSELPLTLQVLTSGSGDSLRLIRAPSYCMFTCVQFVKDGANLNRASFAWAVNPLSEMPLTANPDGIAALLNSAVAVFLSDKPGESFMGDLFKVSKSQAASLIKSVSDDGGELSGFVRINPDGSWNSTIATDRAITCMIPM